MDRFSFRDVPLCHVERPFDEHLERHIDARLPSVLPFDPNQADPVTRWVRHFRKADVPQTHAIFEDRRQLGEYYLYLAVGVNLLNEIFDLRLRGRCPCFVRQHHDKEAESEEKKLMSTF